MLRVLYNCIWLGPNVVRIQGPFYHGQIAVQRLMLATVAGCYLVALFLRSLVVFFRRSSVSVRE